MCNVKIDKFKIVDNNMTNMTNIKNKNSIILNIRYIGSAILNLSIVTLILFNDLKNS